ncbi:4-galactosyl-N-acetylglucosaminide 3-alpha-L-fucosyltransferase FUT6-like [Panonychus citri]|uniref:4-galactosyl-N-acetylglucosaminide 3-alpha-L-fucosyltransferase FUT6-like n=1 Tax=Panonychus citri TaxID=50023 RepID=UPI0023079208|nr:4-galactosyl-N-acetylglucosaminide 3-alpha-L-fucosyltransferase FUT6-like [Panonychus citri]
MVEVQLLYNNQFKQLTRNLYSSKRRKKWILVIIGLLFCLSFTYFFINLFSRSIQVSPAFSTIIYPLSPPIILIWTVTFNCGSWNESTNLPLDCDCIVTRNRSLLPQAKVVLFYWRNTDLSDLPKYKFEGQTWIWHHMESPIHTHRRSELTAFSNYVDCWSSYRTDSDFPTPYGFILPNNESHKSEKSNQVNAPNAFFVNKSRNVAWMVSNCGAPSGRDEYVKELARYIDVDIYGDCGPFKCPRSEGSHCYEYFEKKYRYYLSFENSICTDYYTEKIINLLNYTIIPIVLGGANYSSVLPNHSYIDALSFKSPRYLAMLLRSLSADEKRYNSYFEWKSRFTINNNDYRTLFCQICSRLKQSTQSGFSFSSSTKDHHQLRRSNVLCNHPDKDLFSWWYNETSCKSWTPINQFKFWS